MPLFGNVFAAQPATTTNAVAKPQPAAEPEPIALTPAEPQPAAPIEAAAQPAPAVTPAEGAAAPTEAPQPTTPKAQTKTEPATKQEYVAPASPQEAHDRIEAAATAVPAKITKQQQGDIYIFGGKTFSLRQAFTMLGGAFDKQSQSWSISVERYDNPALCQDTFDAEVERSKKAADATAKREADIQKRIDEAVAKARKQWETEHKTATPATPATDGTITIADAQAATKKAMTLMLTALSKTPEASIDAIIKKAYAS